MASKLFELRDLGQSIWFDDINRDVIHSGRLKELRDRYAVTGGTSNPTIFEKAFTGSEAYEEHFRALEKRNWPPERIVDELQITDVQLAADLFREVFDRTNGDDGYVSIEVSPLIANDTEATIREARRIWEAVNRPNVMVKIPGTSAGIPAIETCLSEGININITLLFSISNYAQVAHVFMSALEKRLEAGEPIDKIASVASFFVSRVDTLVDSKIDAQGDAELAELRGKVGIANAKLAYQRYLELFGSGRWQRLADAGARVQRCLWASTSVKDPRYRDVMYAEELAGPNTVDTMPESTILAFEDHGEVAPRLTMDVGAAIDVLRRLGERGISLDAITDQLQVEGVQKFVDSYNQALQAIRQRSHGVNV
jgi:transaldolase